MGVFEIAVEVTVEAALGANSLVDVRGEKIWIQVLYVTVLEIVLT